ncbi:hypothetical protein [Pseudosulfitobacter pseudonitzschiae]|uniref:hypothetical protein n=1 Tax=Pseudosulfitobacter pseudonitzschiae TaxID=1402135 RepID=UPI001C2F4F52|nr:hypothetical protein [Pseudosulfitobacter pseudonitzschiae]
MGLIGNAKAELAPLFSASALKLGATGSAKAKSPPRDRDPAAVFALAKELC